jgi:hypothetical protein
LLSLQKFLENKTENSTDYFIIIWNYNSPNNSPSIGFAKEKQERRGIREDKNLHIIISFYKAGFSLYI